MKKLSILLASAAALALINTAPALAIPFTTGSFAYNSNTSTTTDVTTTTSFDLTPADMHDLNGGANDFAAYSFPSSLTITTPLVFTNLGASSFNWSNAGLGQFVASNVVALGSGCSGTFCQAAYGVTGVFTFGTDWDNAGSSLSASETWSLTQTGGPGEAISMSGTFNSPSTVTTPEPMTLALFGAGLAGLGAMRRRKAK